MATKELTARQLKMLALAKRKGGADGDALAVALGREYYVSLWTLGQVVQAHMPGGKKAKLGKDYGTYERENNERRQNYWVATYVGKTTSTKPTRKGVAKKAGKAKVAANGNNKSRKSTAA